MAINKQISAKSDQAARLRAAREAAGFKSASDAAQRFRWRASTYMAHENGQNGIRTEPALAYARAFGVDPGWLMTGLEPGKYSRIAMFVPRANFHDAPFNRTVRYFDKGAV